MDNKAGGPVVLAQLQFFCRGFVRMLTRDVVHLVCHSRVFKILLQTNTCTSFMTSPPALTNYVGM